MMIRCKLSRPLRETCIRRFRGNQKENQNTFLAKLAKMSRNGRKTSRNGVPQSFSKKYQGVITLYSYQFPKFVPYLNNQTRL